MGWLRFLGGGRRRSSFNNLDEKGRLTCGRITEQLLIGGELGPRDWAALQNEGVSVVINLQHEQQDIFAPSEKIDGYLWIPAPDGQAPSLEQLEQGVLLIRAAIRRGRKVFVHCKAGQGRAPLLCACYLITEGDTPLEAIGRVREARARTLLTPEQSLRLREFGAAYGNNTIKKQPAAAAENTKQSATAQPALEGTEEGTTTTATADEEIQEPLDSDEAGGDAKLAAPVATNGSSRPSNPPPRRKKPAGGATRAR